MLRTLLLIVCLLGGIGVFAQPQDPRALQETAKSFMRNGDYTNAILVLEKAIEKNPKDLELQKDLVFAHYLNHDYAKAIEKGKALVDRPDADVTSYQIMGMTYKAVEERKECEKLYKKGLKAFPTSGVLYSEYGELLWSKQDPAAIQYWEKGIEVDPNHSGNYYQAAKFYSQTKSQFWALIYGELFVNLESYSKRTAEIKSLLLEGYKRWYAGVQPTNLENGFAQATQTIWQKQAKLASTGLDPQVLTMMRTRFILDWYESPAAKKYPFRLFEFHQQLIREGYFEAYHQWLFGVVQKADAFQQWTSTHSEAWQSFNHFQKNRVFKIPAAQYYH